MAEEPRRKRKKSNAAVWAVLALLILALGGFGIGGFGGSVQNVAEVGDREITVQDYANAVRAEQTRLQQQTGQNLTFQQMQAFGLDQQIMERLLARAALGYEADRLGVSVTDAEIARRIRATPAFQGVDGSFDREGYRFALQNAGFDERSYEAQVRDDAAREILQAAIVGGTEAPDAYTDRLAAWIAETRDVTLATVTEEDLPGGLEGPSEADLEAFYDAHPETFETPERRAITYAWVTPDLLAAEIEPDEETLRQLYEDRADEFRQPPRVLAERLAFPDEDAAQAARDAIAAGETDFDALVADRGLTLEEVDQGELARDDLDPAVGDALFGLEEPSVVGPVETPLGPALYRVNAILDATEVPFEDVRDDLAYAFGMDSARRRIDAAREDIEDRLAGGATLEELGAETDMVTGSLEWDPSISEAIAGYEEFREAATQARVDDFPEVTSLSDGGLFALRLDKVIPPAVPPLNDIREDVAEAWRAETLRLRLSERAEALAADPTPDVATEPESLSGIARDATVEGVPPAVIQRIFEAEPGEIFAAGGDDGRAFVVRLDAVNAADLAEGEAAELRQAVRQQTESEIQSDLFGAYARAIELEAGFSVDAQALAAVQSQLGG